MGHLSLVICHWSFVISCHASKLGMSSEQDAQCSEQDARTTTDKNSAIIDIKV